jgi:hypothetical protein
MAFCTQLARAPSNRFLLKRLTYDREVLARVTAVMKWAFLAIYQAVRFLLWPSKSYRWLSKNNHWLKTGSLIDSLGLL